MRTTARVILVLFVFLLSVTVLASSRSTGSASTALPVGVVNENSPVAVTSVAAAPTVSITTPSTKPTTIRTTTITRSSTIISTTVSTTTAESSCWWWDESYYCNMGYYVPPPPQCYGYNCPYAYQTTTTATTYSIVMETSISTSTSISIPAPVTITATLTNVAVARDTTLETVYGSLMVGFLALFLVTLFLLVTLRSRFSNAPPTQHAQIRSRYSCGACGADVLPKARFCGKCGVPLAHRASA